MKPNKWILPGLVLAGTAAILYLTSLHSYLLFHSLAEVFSIVVACGVFMISWNAKDAKETRNLVYLGIGYLFVAALDLFHTLTYHGMGVLPGDHDYPTKLWVAARYLQTVTLLVFAVSFRLRRRISFRLLFAVYGGAAGLLLAMILVLNWFPTCFVEGVGVTPFKRISEYAISAALAVTLALILRTRRGLDPPVQRLLAASVAVTIASELLFTLYTSSYGFSNLLGHYLKIAAFFLTYQALIAHQVRKRLETIAELETARRKLLHSERALRKANASKDRFFSILAHDLRNPISGVQILADLMDKHYEQLDEQERRKYTARIREGAGQSLQLMDSLLWWVRCQTGKVPWEPRALSLQQLVEDNLKLARTSAENKRISVHCSVEPELTVFADPTMIATVLRNLLSNAVKFTPRNGEVRVSVSTEAETVQVSVSDTGLGIQPEDMEKLFRIDVHHSRKGTEEEPGNGFGLILCKEFVEKNHGRIWARSSPGEGSCFTFTLPLHPPG